MCNKLPYCNPRIDPCLTERIKSINDEGISVTLSSCCGHGVYPETIVCMDRETKLVFELGSLTELGYGKRKGNRYYRKDLKGYYYIPELDGISYSQSFD